MKKPSKKPTREEIVGRIALQQVADYLNKRTTTADAFAEIHKAVIDTAE